MNRHIAAAACGLGLFVLSSGLVMAQPRLGPPQNGPQQQPEQQSSGGMIAGVGADMTVKVLQSVGYTEVQAVKDEAQMKVIRAKINDVVMVVVLFGCQNNVCPTAEFIASFGQQQLDLNYINSYNMDNRFTKLYKDKEGNILFTMDTHFLGGVTVQNYATTAAIYGQLMKNLYNYQPK